MLIFPHMQDVGLLILRIFLGMVFVYHGWPKIKDPHSYGDMLFQGSPTSGLALAIAEFFGGLSMILGFLTEVIAINFIVIMAGAMYYKIVKWKRPFYCNCATGWEYDFVLMGISLALLFLGAGMFSLDAHAGLFP